LVKGIGLKTVEKNRDRILIGGSAVPARQPAAPIARR
jgi:competence protein ComEA